jgi:hypothetical protein
MQRFEALKHYAATIGLVIAATLSLAGCAVVQDKMGGQVFGVSATLMGVTVSASGTIPTATPPAP